MFCRKAGFTLVEVLVASTIGTFIALVAVGALRTISSSARMINSNIDTSAEVRYAADLIARDLTNLYRDSDAQNMKLVGAFEETQVGTTSILTLYTVGRVKARADQPEADVYEAEYFLVQDEEESALYRRLWPYPDEDLEPGGVVIPIARNIDLFQVRFYDGQEWYDEWPEEMQSLPRLVEVNIAAQQPGRDDFVVASFIANFVRVASEQGAAESGGPAEQGGQQRTEQGTEQGGQQNAGQSEIQAGQSGQGSAGTGR